MKSLYDPQVLSQLEARIRQLMPDSPRQWGKMDAAQMLAHCALATEMAAGDVPMKQILLGKILGPIFKRHMLADRPMRKIEARSGELCITGPRNFATERTRLLGVLTRISVGGPATATKCPHPFIGPLTGEEWGTLTYRHVDHHLRQFGV
jgi:hypothetical protein